MTSPEIRADRWKILERWLKEWSLVFSLLLALGVSCVLGGGGVISEDVMPFGDGEHYVLRGMTLYGYLHSGQWAQFWDVFTLPKQSLAPPHYWLFFLLPQSWASTTSYGVIQVVTTYLLLVFGTWGLCRTLDRAEWAPALFLLCASQNISLDDSYFYFADVPFFALGTVALYGQMRAWREGNWRNGVLSGVGAGLMFWVKPPNALIFATTFLLAEIFRLLVVWLAAKRQGIRVTPNEVKGMWRHVMAVATGFIPVTFLALACGGGQSILRLIEANEVSGFMATPLECTGLLRLFYFPLCLTIFYHTVAMLLIFAAMGLAAFILNRNPENSEPEPHSFASFPARLLVPLILAYVLLGEVFSFGMKDKEMRSLLLVLPILWLCFFWLLESWKVRPALIFFAAVAYVVCAYSQILFNTFGSTDVSTQGYQLKDDWLSRLPQSHFTGATRLWMTKSLLQTIQEALPEGGKIAVGSEQIFLTSESLSWTLQHDAALRGKHFPYEFDNFLAVDGKYCRSALVNARAMLLFAHPSLQYSREVYGTSRDLFQFCASNWLKNGSVKIIPFQTQTGESVGCLIVMKEPLSDAQITQLISSTHASELSPEVEFNPPVSHRLSWAECWDILRQWKEKRLGAASP